MTFVEYHNITLHIITTLNNCTYKIPLRYIFLTKLFILQNNTCYLVPIFIHTKHSYINLSNTYYILSCLLNKQYNSQYMYNTNSVLIINFEYNSDTIIVTTHVSANNYLDVHKFSYNQL